MAIDRAQKQNISLVVINSVLVILNLTALLVCFRQMMWFWQIVGYVCGVGFALGSILSLVYGKQACGRSLFVLNVLTFVIIGVLCILHWCGLFDDFSSLARLKQLIRSSGGWAYVVYIVLQFLNVVLLPLPGFLFMLAALSIFGVWPTFWVTLIINCVGSLICFWFGRTCGSKAVEWCVGTEIAEHYQKLLGNKGNVLFFMMQILPFFPDDMLCMIAGLTRMKYSFFLLTMAITKPLYVATVCFLGSGTLIPFSGWGIPVWIIIGLVFVVTFFLFCRYQTAVENWFAKVTQKNKKSTPK